ncbi:hypothetical protein BV898_14871 [Hypsibius exemplaris]|uniref:Methyltransferase domain-containing protein n=1 Tax=Hypsibius exemplaris TaxID=2072580 RepID=A0A9X6N9M1_HYPEX|nr:hypothetical protein BV898_14871 [Hypsibius exemplaris]
MPSQNTEKLLEDDNRTQLYDLLHRLFFDRHWIPTASVNLNCTATGLRACCSFWVSWKAYKPHEVLRLLSPDRVAFLDNLQEKVCRVKQGISEVWAVGSLLDGGYWICLHKLRIAAVTGHCLMYSFGIRDDCSFDEALQKLWL